MRAGTLFFVDSQVNSSTACTEAKALRAGSACRTVACRRADGEPTHTMM
jgi:hypothetical protein